MKTLIKVLVLLAVVLLMALPFLLEYISFRRDKKRLISHKRLRVVICTFAYIIAITFVMYFASETLSWIASIPALVWVAGKAAIPDRIVYFGDVVAVVLVNFAIGVLFLLGLKIVRIGMKRRNLTTPKENGKYTWAQRVERRILQYFHAEKWNIVRTAFLVFDILISAAYLVWVIASLLPALFPADWLPYRFILSVFRSGYWYPTITLLGLWEIYFFLEGVHQLDTECPELVNEVLELREKQIDYKAIDDEVKKEFGNFFECEIEDASLGQEKHVSKEHSQISELIADAVQNDPRNSQVRREVFMDCIDKLVKGEPSREGNQNDKNEGKRQGMLISGNFFSEFSLYFLRYLTAVVARGDSVVFICNNDTQIDAVYDYIIQGFSETQSIYSNGKSKDIPNFDDPIWRVVKVGEEQATIEEVAIEENSILVTSLGFFCSPRFEAAHSDFITLVDVVVFVDIVETMNTYHRQLVVLNTHLRQVVNKYSRAINNAREKDLSRVRYKSRQIQYICFNDTRIKELDKVLENLLSVEFQPIDAMYHNKETLVRCYRLEAKNHTQYITTDEELGILINIAVLCLAKGASNVAIFTNDMIPYAGYEETIRSNEGRIEINPDKVRVNRWFFNPDSYSVILAVDAKDNLPAAVRRYTAMVSNRPALIYIFSRPYLLRDYYVDNLEAEWDKEQLERIPIEEKTLRDVAQNILVKANAEGLSKEDVFNYVRAIPAFEDLVDQDDLAGVLRKILHFYGVPSEESNKDITQYFKYITTSEFNEQGQYVPGIRIVLLPQGKLFESINDRKQIKLVIGADNSEGILAMPKSRLTQRYIAGQNFVYNGKLYTISRVDVRKGELHVSLTAGGMNDEPHQYIQDREYRVELNDEITHDTKHIVINRKDKSVHVKDVYVSVFRAPMEVFTKGYFVIDPHTMKVNIGDDEERSAYVSISDAGNDSLAKQTYRRYGMLSVSSDSFVDSGDVAAVQNGARMLSIRITGEFGDSLEKTMLLASVMLNEIIHLMFPSVADSVVVCPVLQKNPDDIEAQSILRIQPRLTVKWNSRGENDVNKFDVNELVSDTDFNLVIIEDCETDLGVVSVLATGGVDILKALFEPIFNYLSWYVKKNGRKNEYLRFGYDHEPSCFDFESLVKLSQILGNDKHDLKFKNVSRVMETESCDFCGKRYAKGGELLEREDGRCICKTCSKNLVGKDRKTLDKHLKQAKIFLESTYGISVDWDDYDFIFASAAKIVNLLSNIEEERKGDKVSQRGQDIPLRVCIHDRKVFVEHSIPATNLSELLVRSLTHVWQIKNLPGLDEELAEGQIALVSLQYLRFLNQNSLASSRTAYYESADSVSGNGYRAIVSVLLDNPQYYNNPFQFLLGKTGQAIQRVSKVIHENELGKLYQLSEIDRVAAGENVCFYYGKLSENLLTIYDQMLEAIRNFNSSVVVEGTSDQVRTVSRAILYDHPELFWYKTISMSGNTVNLKYGTTQGEAEELQRKIDETVKGYLEGIDASMSAYDVALRLHAKVISSVDYDSIALEQDKNGGPDDNEIDYLRTICGVFINGTAVCEGYARALQYLLQMCGIECGEAVGKINKGSIESIGEAHAWNIVKIDGDYYYIDTTWDDSSNTVQMVKSTDLGFDYFCVTTEEMKRTRDFSYCPVEMPECKAVRANYFTHNDLILSSYDLDRIKEFAKAAAKNECSSVAFKCSSEHVFESAMNKLFTSDCDVYEVVECAAKVNRSIVKNTYSYRYDRNIWTITVDFKHS